MIEATQMEGKALRPSREANFVGRRFGRYVVVKQVPSWDQGTRWLCRCDCGAEHEVDRKNLVRGLARSCGCSRIELSLAKKKGRAPLTSCSKLRYARLAELFEGVDLS